MSGIKDPADIGAVVRAARRLRGMTQDQLAQRAGVSRQWVVAVERGHDRAEIGKVSKLLAAIGVDLEPRLSRGSEDRATRTWLTAAEAAEAVRIEIEEGEVNFALRILARALDELRRLTDPRDIETFLYEPTTTGDRRWDTLLGAAVGRACRELGIEAPSWANVRPLPSWWFPVFDPVLTARTMQRTPIDFAARGIWLDSKALDIA